MPIVSPLILLVIVGVVLYLVETYIPLSPPIKVVIRVVVVLFLCLAPLNAFGIVSTPNLRLR
jgi:hypothetical protein